MTTLSLEVKSGRSRVGRWLAGGLALAFGVATLNEGGHVLFGGAAAREEAGHVVDFVLRFNFAAGFLSLATGAATLFGWRWATRVAQGLAVATLLVFAAFGVHALTGGAFEPRTLVAMIVRSGFWVAQALVLPGLLRRPTAN